VQFPRKNQRFGRRARVDREELPDLGKFGEAGIERDQQLKPARDFEKRPVFAKNRFRPAEDLPGRKEGSGNVDFPSLSRVVAERASRIEPLGVAERQRLDRSPPGALELFELRRAERR
jgi:hypothetical protein